MRALTRFHWSGSALLALCFSSCEQPVAPAPAEQEPIQAAPLEVIEETSDPVDSVVRITTTRQLWSPGQPWEKQSPRRRRSLGAVVSNSRILTTAEMVANATLVELETTDGLKRATARVVAVDYEANFALLEPEGDAAEDFLSELVAFEIADTPTTGDRLEIIQVQDNGNSIITQGRVQSIDIVSSFLAGQYFLTYEVKASMQSASSSYTLPVLSDGKLAGLLTNYNSKDQISDISSTEVLRNFLVDAEDGEYMGFPSLGVSTTSTEDSNFRAWLELSDDLGGVYLSKIRSSSPADKAGLKVGDVITSVDDHDIDRQGYFDHELYGRLFWSHLVRGAKSVGDTVKLGVLRDGEAVDIEALLERQPVEDQLIPSYTFGKAPNYLVKGGFIFQELTQPLLASFGDDWQSRAPLDLLAPWENPDPYEEDHDRIVFLAGVIATPATVGYESLRNLIVTEVNGKPVRDMKSAIEAFDSVPENGLHSIKFRDEEIAIYLDEVLSTSVDTQLIQRGIPRLSRAE